MLFLFSGDSIINHPHDSIFKNLYVFLKMGALNKPFHIHFLRNGFRKLFIDKKNFLPYTEIDRDVAKIVHDTSAIMAA